MLSAAISPIFCWCWGPCRIPLITIDAGTLNRDGRVMLGVSVLMVLMALNGVITQWMGFGLLAILAGFTFLLYRRARQEAV